MPKQQMYSVTGDGIKGFNVPVDWHGEINLGWTAIGGGQLSQSQQIELYAKVAAVYRAANLSAKALAGIPFTLTSTKTDEEFDNSADWQNKVGFLRDPVEMLRLWRLSLFMHNAAYGFMEGNGVTRKNLRYIVADSITPKTDDNDGLLGFYRQVGAGRDYYPVGSRRVFYIWRLDHTTELLPSDHTEFLAASNAAGVLLYADYWTKEFFKRGGIKPHILTLEGSAGASKEVAETLENRWTAIMRGTRNAIAKVFNNPNGNTLKWHALGDGLGDLKNSDVYNNAISNVAMALGMPKSILLSDAANYATANQDYQTWMHDEVFPYAAFMAGQMNERLFAPLGLRMDFRLDMVEKSIEEKERQASAYATYISQGVPPAIAAQIVGIDMPPGYEYDDLEPDEEEPEPTPEPDVTDNEPEATGVMEEVEDDIKHLSGSRHDHDQSTHGNWADDVASWQEKNVRIAKKAPKTKPPGKMQGYINSAYDLGKKAKERGYNSAEYAIRDPDFGDALMMYDLPEHVAFSAGMTGKDKPYWVHGWRYGEIPSGGQSFNFQDGTLESGLSVMALSNGMSTPDPSFEMFGGSRVGGGLSNPIYVSGFLNTTRTGADGEPLLLWAEKTGKVQMPAKFVPSLEQLGEIQLWRNLAMKAYKRDKSRRVDFETKTGLPVAMTDAIKARIAIAPDADSMYQAFELSETLPAPQPAPQPDNDAIKALADAINKAADAVDIKADGYKPNQAMQSAARRALEWRQEYGRGGTEVGIARARDIANGRNLSLDTIGRMVSFFARHAVDKESQGFREGEDGYPSNGRIAWDLWGGDAGRRWASAIWDGRDDE